MFKGIKSKLKKAFKAKPKAKPRKVVKKSVAKPKAAKPVKREKPVKQKQDKPVKQAKPAPKQAPKQDNQEMNFFEEVTLTCSGCGKKVKELKYPGMDVDDYVCRNCSGVETELGEDFG
jgi:hypothetical protein